MSWCNRVTVESFFRVLLFFFGIGFVACDFGPPVIAVQPFEGFDATQTDSVESALKREYGYEVIQLSAVDLPAFAFTTVKSARYRADSLIWFLKETCPDSIDYIIGCIASDISFTKRNKDGTVKEPASKYQDWGIFGLGYRPGPSCVISTYRLKHADRSVFIDRLQKITVHELGHNLGLKHCTQSESCVMRDAAETIKTIDQVGFSLCDHCRRKIPD